MKKFRADFISKNSNEPHANQYTRDQNINTNAGEQKNKINTLSDASVSTNINTDSQSQQDEDARGRRIAYIAGKNKRNSPIDITERTKRLASERRKEKKKREKAKKNGEELNQKSSPKKDPTFLRIKKGESDIFVTTKKSDSLNYDKDVTLSKLEEDFKGRLESDKDLSRLIKRSYTKNTIEIGGFGKSFTFQYGKNKIRTDQFLGVHSPRRILSDALRVDRAILKGTLKGVKNLGARGAENLANQNEVTRDALQFYKGSRIAFKTSKFALKATTKIASHATVGTINAGIATYMGAKVINDFEVDPERVIRTAESRILNRISEAKGKVENFKTGINDSIDRVKKKQKDMKDAVNRLRKMSEKQRREALGKGMKKVGGTIKETIKEKAKKLSAFLLGKIKKIFISMIFGLLPVIIGLALIVIIALPGILIFMKDIEKYDCIEDYEAYLKIVKACEEYEEAWREAMEVEMIEKFTLPQPEPSCPYGNNNTIEMKYTCGSEHDEDAVKGFIIDPEDVFNLICAYYDGNIQNMSSKAEEQNPDAPDEKEIMSFVQLILETYYPYDYIASDRIEIKQDIFLCYDYLTEEDIEEGWKRTEYVESNEKPNLYYPSEGIEYTDEDTHVFINTFVTYHLEPFTYVLKKLANKETIDRYRSYRSLFQSYFTISNEEDLKDIPSGFLESIHNFSSYDKLSLDEFSESVDSWPVLETSRDNFVEMVKAHCDGSIPYSWGGSSFSGSDCSGFICLMFQQVGYNIFGNTAWLWENSYAIDSTDAMAGDLIFKQAPTSNGINHVGILYDNSDEEDCLFMHCASGSGSVINDYDGFIMYRRLPVWFSDDK